MEDLEGTEGKARMTGTHLGEREQMQEKTEQERMPQ